MHFEVRHAIPGRVRLRIPSLARDPSFAKMFLDWLSRLEHVESVRFNPSCFSVVICYSQACVTFQQCLESRIRRLAVVDLQPISEPPASDRKAKAAGRTSLALPTISLALSCLNFPGCLWLNLPLLVWNSLPIWKRALSVLRDERRLNVDFLDGVAVAIALAQAQPLTGAIIVWLISLGDWIRDRTGAASRRAIKNLLDYQTRQAWRERNGEMERVPVTALQAGDTVHVYPGELIPVDGEVIRGQAAVDQKTITGESLPVQRAPGDKVFAATVLREGKLVLHALRVGEETTAAQIVHLVETAPIGETRMQNYAEKFADRLVAPWLAASVAMYAATANLERLVSMLIIDYGTGMRVAAPTTVLAAMTKAARHGIVIKSGSHMEKLARVDTVVFDKTGTLTRGVPQVLDVICYNKRRFPERKILALAAAAEVRHKHPVAEAILAKAQEIELEIPERTYSHYQIGMGVEAQVNGYRVHLGSCRFLEANGVSFGRAAKDVKKLNQHGASTLLLAVNGELAALIPYADQVRHESRAVLRTLHNHGVKRTVMLTGDNRTVAAAVARQLGIDEFFSDTLPSDKAEIVQQLQRDGRIVAMVGDGINDSPALAYADIGIAMKNGADVARESADVVLMEDNLWKLMSAIEISKAAMGLIRQNYAIIAALNTVAVGLSIPAGLVSPALTTVISNGSAILASLNAMRPLLE